MRYKDLFENSIKRIRKNRKPSDIQILIQKSFSLTKEKFWSYKNCKITDRSGLQRFYRKFNKLLKGEPIQYIINEAEFYSLSLFVKKGVLIPRPETELLVEETLKLVNDNFKILDIGAGSGAISIAIAKNSNCFVTALEKSEQAIPILKRNISNHKLKERIKIVKSDLFPEKSKFLFDIIVSNPPYISKKDWESVEKKVKKFEPEFALVGGKDGTEIINKIISNSAKYLKKNGHLLIEIGYDQYESVPKIFKDNNFKDIKIIFDYNGIGRIVTGRL